MSFKSRVFCPILYDHDNDFFNKIWIMLWIHPLFKNPLLLSRVFIQFSRAQNHFLVRMGNSSSKSRKTTARGSKGIGEKYHALSFLDLIGHPIRTIESPRLKLQEVSHQINKWNITLELVSQMRFQNQLSRQWSITRQTTRSIVIISRSDISQFQLRFEWQMSKHHQ